MKVPSMFSPELGAPDFGIYKMPKTWLPRSDLLASRPMFIFESSM